VYRHAKDSDESMTTMSGCKNLNVIKDLTKQFANNFSFFPSKGKKKVKNVKYGTRKKS
jgi:hypothetical protein